MTLSLRNIPIKRKLTIIVMITSCTALLVASIIFLMLEQTAWKRALVKDTSVIAEIFGENCASALTFSDDEAADKILQSLSADKHVVAACVYDKEGIPFAHYQRGDIQGTYVAPQFEQVSQYFGEGDLNVFRKIQFSGEEVGAIYIQADLQELHDRLIRYAGVIALVLLGVSFLAFLIGFKLQKAISEPILQLAETTRTVAAEKNYYLRAKKQTEDELGELIDSFNDMLSQIQSRDSALQKGREELEQRVATRTLDLLDSNYKLKREIQEREQAEQRLADANRELINLSRMAGMAEVATSVLHNVGNVLNSVNVSANLISDQIRESKSASLSKIATLIEQRKETLGDYIANDPQGRKIPEFLHKLSQQMAKDQKALLQELESLRKNIEHIKEIVSMQQSYAKVSGVVETVDIGDLIEDAIRMNAGALARHDVKLVRQFESSPLISIEKHKVLQILVNLIRNAKYACDDGACPEKQMILRTDNDVDGVVIQVIDNGIGIAPENLTKIFAHGFTTRKRGHGFGLHSGALTARELGGSLTAHSDGINRGATFTLKLPYHQPTSHEPHEINGKINDKKNLQEV